MEFKVGRIEGDLAHKYLICREADSLVFYASSAYLSDENRPVYHKDILAQFGLNNVLSGGSVVIALTPSFDQLEIRSGSDLGFTPSIILERFLPLLEKEYKSRFPEIKSVSISVDSSIRPEAQWQEVLTSL